MDPTDDDGIDDGVMASLLANQHAHGGSKSSVDVESPAHVDEPGCCLFTLTIIACIPAFLFGFSIGYTSPIMAGPPATNLNAAQWAGDDAFCVLSRADVDGVPYVVPLTRPMNCNLDLDDDIVTWIGSLLNIGALCGSFFGGWLTDYAGRRRSMFTAGVLMTAGYVLVVLVPVGFADNVPVPESEVTATTEYPTAVWLMLAARIVQGFAIGIVCNSVNVYLVEIASTNTRGLFGTLFQASVTVGIFSAYTLGAFVDWRIMAYVALGLSGVFVFLVWLLPESPSWLLSNNKYAEAKRSFSQLRSRRSNIDKIVRARDEAMHRGAEDSSQQSHEKLPSFRNAWVRKALAVGIGLMCVQQLSGINAIMFYCGRILQSVTEPELAANLAIGIQGMQVLITIASAFFMERVGRKPLLLFSCSGLVVCCFTLGGFYFLKLENDLDRKWDWVAVASLYGYVAFFSMGMGAIPWFLINEIFPTNIRGAASSIATASNWLLSFAITRTVIMIKSSIQYYGLFWCYGGVGAVGGLFILFFVPETKGKGMATIELFFRGKYLKRQSVNEIPRPVRTPGRIR